MAWLESESFAKKMKGKGVNPLQKHGRGVEVVGGCWGTDHPHFGFIGFGENSFHFLPG